MWGIPTQKSSIEVIPQEKGSIRTHLHHLHPPLQYHSIYPHHSQYYNITHPDREHFESRIHPNFKNNVTSFSTVLYSTSIKRLSLTNFCPLFDAIIRGVIKHQYGLYISSLQYVSGINCFAANYRIHL